MVLILIVSLISTPTAHAQINQEINYQGKLTDNTGAALTDGDYLFTFRLYTIASGGSAVFTETATTTLQNGLFSYLIGSSTSLGGVDFTQALYLGVEVAGDGEMAPRKRMGSVPAAFEADNAQTFDGLATTSFLRSNQDDTASGLLTFSGGLISAASSTITNLTTNVATTTTLVINGEAFTDFTGSGLTFSAGALTATISESNLNIAVAPTDEYLLQASSTAVGGFVWVATSTLGISGGSSVSFGTDNQIPFTNIGGTDYDYSSDFTFDGSQLTLGGTGLSLTGTTANIALGSNFLSGDGGDEGIFVDSDGNVGIGTTTPAKTLDVWGDFQVGTSSTPTMIVQADGGVGISTKGIAADALLHIEGASVTSPNFISADFVLEGNGGVSMQFMSNTTASQALYFGDSSDGSSGRIVFDHTDDGLTIQADNHIEWHTLASEKVRLTSAGNLGIGTTTPTSQLTTTGTVQFEALAGGILATDSNGVLGTTTVGVSDLTNEDFGDFTVSGGAATLDTNTVTENEIDLSAVTLGDFTDDVGFLFDITSESFLDLVDTPGSFTNTHVLYMSGAAVTSDADFTFDGSQLTLGGTGLSLTGTTANIALGSNFLSGDGGDEGIFVDSDGNVGIGTTTTSGKLTIAQTADDVGISLHGFDDVSSTESTMFVNQFGHFVLGDVTAVVTEVNTNEYMRVTGAGVILNNSGFSSADFRVKGDTDTQLLFIDASTDNVGIGTSTPEAKLTLENLTLDGAGVVGLYQNLQTENTVADAIQYGNRLHLNASNTATTTIVGSVLRVTDNTSFGNVVRGLEVQTFGGGNTQGENTALSGFARTFGVRGKTEGDAGGLFEPAGGFFETGGTTQGNAIRGFSSSITTAELLSLFQEDSDFDGTGLLMNFGNDTGSFSSTTSKFVDFQNAGTSKFIVTAHGTTTIGDGTTNNMAGLQIGFGGLCVDNDGSCIASTTGLISSVSSHTGNSDLAEMYFSSEALVPGEIVMADGFLSVSRATSNSAKRVLGVVSTKPGLVMGADDTSLIANQKGYPLALSGRVPVRLSNENGNIVAGDPLTLSSISGVAMKATDSAKIVGYALESFDGTHAYTDGYVNQFGDDIATPDFQASNINTAMTEKAGCYFGGGSATGEEAEECDLTDVSVVDSTDSEEYALAQYEAEQAALQALRDEPAEDVVLGATTVQIGSVTMFVELGYHFNSEDLSVLTALTSTSSELVLNSVANDETLWDRITQLAQGFVAGVLTISGLDTERVQTQELCVDDVCIDAAALRTLLAEPSTDQPSNQSVESSEVPDEEIENQPENEDGESEDSNEEIVTETDTSETSTTTATTTSELPAETSDTSGTTTATSTNEIVDEVIGVVQEETEETVVVEMVDEEVVGSEENAAESIENNVVTQDDVEIFEVEVVDEEIEEEVETAVSPDAENLAEDTQNVI